MFLSPAKAGGVARYDASFEFLPDMGHAMRLAPLGLPDRRQGPDLASAAGDSSAEVAIERERHDRRSPAIAVASPPPMHSKAPPVVPPVARSAPSSVTRIRAPDAPIGWPKAQAPPCTLIFTFDPDLIEAVRELAREEGRQVPALVDEALADLIEKRRLGKLYKKLAE